MLLIGYRWHGDIPRGYAVCNFSSRNLTVRTNTGERFRPISIGAFSKATRHKVEDEGFAKRCSLVRREQVCTRHPGERPGPEDTAWPLLDSGFRRNDGSPRLHRAGSTIAFADEIAVSGDSATMKGSFAITEMKRGTLEKEPLFMDDWRARDDSNVRPLPSEGNTLSN